LEKSLLILLLSPKCTTRLVFARPPDKGKNLKKKDKDKKTLKKKGRVPVRWGAETETVTPVNEFPAERRQLVNPPRKKEIHIIHLPVVLEYVHVYSYLGTRRACTHLQQEHEDVQRPGELRAIHRRNGRA
jgi:hypothetical protein